MRSQKGIVRFIGPALKLSNAQIASLDPAYYEGAIVYGGSEDQLFFSDGVEFKAVEGEEGPPGPSAPNVIIIGSVPDVIGDVQAILNAAADAQKPTPLETNDGIVDLDTGDLWIYTAAELWANTGNIAGVEGPEGPQGDQGPPGIQGPGAFTVAGDGIQVIFETETGDEVFAEIAVDETVVRNTGSQTIDGSINLTGAGVNYQIGSETVLSPSALGEGVIESSLQSVGTITVGSWQASTIAAAHGGTGNDSYTFGDLLFATGVTELGTRQISQLVLQGDGVTVVNNGDGTINLDANIVGGDNVTVDVVGNAIEITGADTDLGVIDGDTTGPTITSSTGEDVVIPSASGTVSGVVTTGTQTFAGTKTFNSTITGSVSGSASTLGTARFINGTAFDGSQDITTANWGTSRDISIGGTSKAVNGSENVTWTVSEIAAQTAVELATARNINGVSFDGSQDITTPTNVENRTTNESAHVTFVGTTGTGNQQSYTNADFRFNPSTGELSVASLSETSDISVKENIESIDGEKALQAVMSLRGVTYNFKNTLNKNDRHIGLIAQEVEPHLPELVSTTTSPESFKSVRYSNTVAVLIEAIKEQQKQIDELKKQISRSTS